MNGGNANQCPIIYAIGKENNDSEAFMAFIESAMNEFFVQHDVHMLDNA